MFISESLESYRCKSMVSLLLSSELSLSVDCNFPIMINQCPHSKFIIRLLIFNFCNLPKLIYFKTNSTKTSGFFKLMSGILSAVIPQIYVTLQKVHGCIFYQEVLIFPSFPRGSPMRKIFPKSP